MPKYVISSHFYLLDVLKEEFICLISSISTEYTIHKFTEYNPNTELFETMYFYQFHSDMRYIGSVFHNNCDDDLGC